MSFARSSLVDAGEARLGRFRWEPGPVLLAVETLFLDGGSQMAAAEKRG